MYIVIDTETTGLPVGKFSYDFKNLPAYDTARLVSIAWVILDRDLNELQRKTYIVKPDKFIIPFESENIHGISTAQALSFGLCLIDVLTSLLNDLRTYDVNMMVAHNIKFDYGVIMSECHRLSQSEFVHGNVRDLKISLACLAKMCTMQMAKDCGLMTTFPKLRNLYAYFQNGDSPKKEHDALEDVLSCAVCLRGLLDVK